VLCFRWLLSLLLRVSIIPASVVSDNHLCNHALWCGCAASQYSEDGLFNVANGIVEGVAGVTLLTPSAPLTSDDDTDGLRFSNSVADVVVDLGAEPHVAAVYVWVQAFKPRSSSFASRYSIKHVTVDHASHVSCHL
jgi:hypothetical protein